MAPLTILTQSEEVGEAFQREFEVVTSSTVGGGEEGREGRGVFPESNQIL